MTKSSALPVAPDFSLADQRGTIHTLSAYRGVWVVLYFYPKDDTPGCTIQACDIRDSWDAFLDLGVVVFGVSPDTVESHQEFAKKYMLPFILLADPDKKVIQAYSAWQDHSSLSQLVFGVQRSTVIINPEGLIVEVYKNVDAKTHAVQVLADLKKHLAKG